MNPEIQRIAIAEACGILNCITVIEAWKRDKPTRLDGYCEGQRVAIPDYLNDLNAMHEAERAIGLHGNNFRGRMLRRSWGTYTAFLDSRFLTANERAQALLMTIKKWTYDN